MRRMLSGLRALARASAARAAGALAGAALLLSAGASEAQEIQLTGPLAGAPAVRKLRLHRQGRLEVAPGATFTLLDEYQRTIMPGLRITYHPLDWLGIGVWGGYGFQSTTALADQLQEKAVDARNCHLNPGSEVCRLTEVNITRKGAGGNATGSLADDQLAKFQWVAAPQLTFVPFRGKLSLFSALFVDTDANLFVGGAVVGLKERKECGPTAEAPCSETFELVDRIAFAPTFGLGLNFYPTEFFGFGAEFRALPYAWNTSGFDNRGAGSGGEFPDTAVNGADREFRFNSMITVSLSFQIPPGIKLSD